jgi:hypothetical protein
VNRLDEAVVEARFRLSEWLTAREPPGRRVRCRLPFVAVEVERIWGTTHRPTTGHTYRSYDWIGLDPSTHERLGRLRFVVPWLGGQLWVMEADE